MDETSEEAQSLLDGIKKLVVDYNLGSISDDSGYTGTQLSSAGITWKKGKTLKSSKTSKYSGYGKTKDLDFDPTPFDGMDVIQLLTKRQMDMLKDAAKFPGITYSTKTLKNGKVQNTVKGCKYYAPKTVGFYKLRNTFAKLT